MRSSLTCVGGVLVLASAVAAGGAALSAQAPSDPEVVRRLNALAATLFQQGQAAAVIPEIKSLLAADPSLAEAHYLLGAAYAIEGSPEMLGEAKAELRQALALRPALLQARVYLAGVYLQLGRAEQARDELRTALQQAPGQPQLLTQLAEAERQSGDPTAALATSGQALVADPRNQQAHYHHALALIDVGRADEATTELSTLVSAGVPEAAVHQTLARLQLDAGRPADALKTLRAGLALAPGHADLQVLAARALRLTGALANAEKALAAARAATPPAVASAAFQQTEADIAMEEGLLRLAQKRTAEAIAALERATEISPEYGAAHRGLALALLAGGQKTRAAAEAALAATLGAPLSKADQARLESTGGRGATRR